VSLIDQLVKEQLYSKDTQKQAKNIGDEDKKYCIFLQFTNCKK
jgi:hypothetical protein